MTLPLSQEKKQEWKNIILKQQASKLSIKHWCKENKISANRFYYWKQRLVPGSINSLSFTELKDNEETGIFLEYKGINIHLKRHFDPTFLKHCIKVLEEKC